MTQQTTAKAGPGPAAARLSWWSSAWRYGFAVLVGLMSAGLDAVVLAEGEAPPWRAAVVLGALPIGLAAIVLLRWRHRYPLTIALALTVVSGFAPAASGASLIAIVSLATRRRWQDIAPVMVVSLVSTFAYERSPLAVEETPIVLLVVFVILFTGIFLAIGWYVGARRDLLDSLRERAETAEREQSLRAEQARANERAAIAREMHDVLAHRISLIVMHAGALTYRRDLTPEQSAQAAHVIETAAHEALADLRDVLGVLRAGPADDEGHRPQPTLADVEALLDQARAAGTHIEVSTDLPAAQPPAAVGRHAYRIVQEGLTNARKHATQAPVTLRLQGRPGGELSLRLSNPIVAGHLGLPSAGSGLTGLAERAELAGGRLESGRRGRLFVVQAWLPWPQDEAGPPFDSAIDSATDSATDGANDSDTRRATDDAIDHASGVAARPEPLEAR